MRKILFHLNCFEQGGAERVVSNLVNQLVKENYEIIAATQWQGEVEFHLDERVKRVHVGLRREDEKKSRITKIFLRFKYLRELIKKEHPEVIISFTRRPNYRALISSIGTGVPVIAAVRQDPKSYYNSLADKILIPVLYRKAAGCVFQTKEQQECFPVSLQRRSRIILNPVNDKYLDIPKPLKREKTVVQSGRLVDFKNQAMLLKAFIKVHEKHPDYVLKIYGGDSFDGTKEKLEAIIKEYGAQEYMLLMGGSDNLEKELPRACAYAFSSDYEGMPNALLEAMALGLPVVATDCPCGGPRTVIEDGENGLLIPVGDEQAMAEGINRLIEDRRLAEYLGDNARNISKRINGKAVLGQWMEYIEEVLARV
ncbi:glycosyltransferase family 4 protein [Lachnospiraceae bacterium]|jgi:glycosyltransferase involved in cell wall biosynthesis|nr:glycosyltransferase family 4 protein [Lachnospiraceae bacterium]